MNIKNSRFIEITARIGYVAKGFIYFTIGLLAFQSAIGIGGDTSGSTKVLQQFIYEPFGFVLLIICAAGLLAHAIWRILQGFIDPEEQGTDKNDILFRIVDVLTGFIYLSLCYAAYQILMGAGAKTGDHNTEIWIGKILILPFGKWIVLFLAAIVAIIGVYQFYSAYTASFEYSFDVNRMSKKARNTLRQLGRIGILAWGVVYFMIAFLFFQAAIHHDANQAGGLEDALNALAEQPYGIWILGTTSAGLLIYGIYLFVLSYYHQIYR